MKIKAKNIVLSFLGSAAFVCLSLGVTLSAGNSIEAQAAQTTIFKSPGASIRMNKQDGLNGIRFPMFMDESTFNTLTSNATIKSEDVTFGTLIIPTDKLTGTLNVNTPLAKNLVTYGYNENDEFVNVWTECTDEDYPDCMQGYAYIHSIPDTSLDRNLTAVGYYTTDGGVSYTYTTPIERHVSYVADAAIKSGDYSATQITVLEEFLANYTITFEGKSETTTQTVKYGKTYTLPAISITTPADSMLDWYEKVGEGYDIVDLSQGGVTALKNTQYALRAGESVTYTTTLQNKENIYGSDPCVTYKDGYYYYVYFDSKQKVYVLKSPSLEDILDGSYSGWGDSTATCVYDPNGTTGNENSAMAEGIWAPELQYIQGKWYIYLSGRAKGTSSAEDERMFVLECKSQDPTGEYETPVQLCPSGFSGRYAIDGHAFEYNGQLYYTFSGQKLLDNRPRIYICTMSSPTSVNNDAVNISQGSSLEEGPCTIVDGTDLYLMYSKGDYNGVNYRVLYYKLNGTNPLDKNSWSSKGECLQQDSTVDIYCTGHNHIFKDANGQIWTSYHGVVGTDGAGTETYLINRRVMVQPISVVDGALNFGGVQDTVTITDQDGLYYANSQKTEYYVNGEGSGRLWKNNGKTFTVSTTITRLSNEKDYCAGITLYERKGDGTFNRLLIGVEEEGNLFLCKDYARTAYKYKYVGWQWDNEGTVNLTVTYTAGASTAESTITIEISNSNNSKSKKHTYTLDQINAIVSDTVGEESKAFNLNFTGDFEIGLGGNRGKCKFTNVSFAFEKFDISFVDPYGKKTTKSYEYGSEFELPEVAEREGFVFLGWAERTGDDTYAEPTLTPNLTVTGAKEYVAKFEAVGPTYEKPALGANVFKPNNTYAEGLNSDGEYRLNCSGAGAAFFEDVKIPVGTNYVVYATINYLDPNATSVGLAVGTLYQPYNFAVFSWKKEGSGGQIYECREADEGKQWAWNGESKTNISIAPKEATIALVHVDGEYYFFVDGVNMGKLNDNGNDIINKNVGVSAGKVHDGYVRVGLGVYNAGNSTFSDWGVSTDVNEINKYFGAIGAEIYSGTSIEVTDGVATYKADTYGAQTFDGVEIEQGADYMVYATVESGMTAASVGFVIGTLETESKFLMLHWRRDQKDFYVFRDGKGSGSYHADELFKTSIGTNGAEIALIYRDGTYYAFLNGTLACQFNSSFDNGWGGTFNVASQIGKTGTIKVGLSIANGIAQFSNWGVSTDASEIDKYFGTYEKPALGANVFKPNNTYAEGLNSDGAYRLNCSGAGAAFFEDVKIPVGTNYVVYATINYLDPNATSVGFAVGTLYQPYNFAVFSWKKEGSGGQIYECREADEGKQWAWNGESKTNISIAPKEATIALVHVDGEYYFFVDGVNMGKLNDNGNDIINKNVGVSAGKVHDGYVRVGLGVYNAGASTFSNWGVSTDAKVLRQYTGTTYEKPALGANVFKPNNTYAEGLNSDGAYQLNCSGAGAAFFEDVKIPVGTNYVVYATINYLDPNATSVGLAVGTLYQPYNFAVFSWKKEGSGGQIYECREADESGQWGWNGESKTNISVAPKKATIALLHLNGNYYFFVDGVNMGKLNDNGNDIINKNVGVSAGKVHDGYVRVGLGVYNAGASTFSDWGVSTDISVINQYSV